MASSSISSSINRDTYMFCYCGERMFAYTSWMQKNPDCRFTRCPNAKSRYRTGFTFLDDELPCQYFKDLVYDLHCRSKQAGNNEQDGTKIQLLKALEELNSEKSRVPKDKVIYFLVGVVAALMMVIGVMVLN